MNFSHFIFPSDITCKCDPFFFLLVVLVLDPPPQVFLTSNNLLSRSSSPYKFNKKIQISCIMLAWYGSLNHLMLQVLMTAPSPHKNMMLLSFELYHFACTSFEWNWFLDSRVASIDDHKISFETVSFQHISQSNLFVKYSLKEIITSWSINAWY